MAIRNLDMKRQTAQDTLTWLRSLEFDEDVICMISVLDALEHDLTRAIEKRELTEREYYLARNASLLAGLLLEEHLDDYRDALSPWDCTQVPQNAVELIAVVLTDALDRFAETILTGKAKNFKPLTNAELTAVMAILGN